MQYFLTTQIPLEMFNFYHDCKKVTEDHLNFSSGLENDLNASVNVLYIPLDLVGDEIQISGSNLFSPLVGKRSVSPSQSSALS